MNLEYIINVPPELNEKREFCWYVLDIIDYLFNRLIDRDLSVTNVEYDSQKENPSKSLDWLLDTGREELFVKILSKNLSIKLLDDLISYIRESLSNLERGNLTISCDLLRKPLKDNLLYLEWLLFDDKQLTHLVYNQKIDEYALGRSGLSKEYIKEIVTYNVKNNNYISDDSSELIYDIRYNYDSHLSLELAWNKATHLVTTGKKIRSIDFNFLNYDSPTDIEEFFKYLYGKIPMLLIYILGITESIFDKYFKNINTISKQYNIQLVVNKYLDMHENYLNSNLPPIEFFLYCENCKEYYCLEKNNFNLVFEEICPKCKNKIKLNKYFFI
ncbi:TPA: hypothetical protein ACSQRE_000104 [Clostridium perfringens]|uniref:hypothetical protein n=1 Tax=Clostridium perfringens TaxID=1502 RepID=UPI000B386C5F|nr:hypothetical protein [Clostridium perfringens]OUN51925.1 hypothetical protein B5G18_11785 [Clostridium perfringens]OUP46194.1 hypothetical protein B5F20_09495 [Clostridium perfringens]